ncbi:MAG: aldehyde ferredoxin oxidoreductase N-terminal domain-containing protein [Anaerolineales bacterium]|jgi:aldehyde:ferredoxin oxidoreductase
MNQPSEPIPLAGRQRTRRILVIDASEESWDIETLDLNVVERKQPERYLVFSGEPLCQYLLRRDPQCMVIACGPAPFLTGNKATVGFVSPLTGVPNYGYIGGRVAAQLFFLGLDAIVLNSPRSDLAPMIHVAGSRSALSVSFHSVGDLPRGQRSAYYWLIERYLDGEAEAGSVLTLGDGAYLGYQAASLAAESIYHAGRGGSGAVFSRFASAMVLRGEPLTPFEYFGEEGYDFAVNPNRELTPLIDKHCARLSSRTGGTIIKLFKTGASPSGKNTLPAWNATNLGYAMADAGDERILKATREGQTGCHWCQVHCRHYHSVPVDYAPGGTDLYLDDFEPAYAVHAMLGLVPEEDTHEAQLALIAEVDERLMRAIEQMGLDVIDAGVALSALFEGVQRGFIPPKDVPDCIVDAEGLGSLEAAAQALAILRSSQAASYPALRAIGDGPQALADRYPEMQDLLFTCGKRTLANPGHCNALWTFLMPFSRFFGHYSGQIYKIKGELPPADASPETVQAFSSDIIRRMLQREFYWLLCNAFSLCAFTFVIFSKDGKGYQLREDDLLPKVLQHYGIHVTSEGLETFSQVFWAQSIDLKNQHGWTPPSAADFPERVYTALAITLGRAPDELAALMDSLIAEWKRQGGEILDCFGYTNPWHGAEQVEGCKEG